jgi:hypothetical protein
MTERVFWYFSSVALILLQFIVLQSFNTSLSFKRCMNYGDCLKGRICAGLNVFDPESDPYSSSTHRIPRGACHDCSSSLGGRKEIFGLLDTLCPTGAPECVVACFANCSSVDVTTTHQLDYSSTDRQCAADCAASSASCSAMLGPALDMFSEAASDSVVSNAGFNRFLTFLSMREQCAFCSSSVLADRTYSNAAEIELMNVLKMSIFDYISLGLASLIVALSVTREVRDMLIGDMMIRYAKKAGALKGKGLGNLLKGEDSNGEALSHEDKMAILSTILLRYSIGFLSSMRRYLLVPSTLTTVVLLVMRLGGDTVSVMLNTMATLYSATRDTSTPTPHPCDRRYSHLTLAASCSSSTTWRSTLASQSSRSKRSTKPGRSTSRGSRSGYSTCCGAGMSP